MNMRFLWPGLALLLLSACPAGERADRPDAETDEVPPGVHATLYWADDTLAVPADERNGLYRGWMEVVDVDSAAWGADRESPEAWEDISGLEENWKPIHVPLGEGASGPSVLRIQVLLDRALFSPGVIDGNWGMNTEKAVYWFQSRHGLARTGVVDRETLDRLVRAAGDPATLVREHRLTGEDVAGPFVTIPDSIYLRAEMRCLCYESLPEKLGELFHATPELLAQLNPDLELGALEAGQLLVIPNVRDRDARLDVEIDQLVVSDAGRYVHALDGQGRILFHFPSTLGAAYDPSPRGDFRVVSITEDPWWHYQPQILAHVDDDKPEAMIPPGPNSPVGVVWMALSVPHYGIHGTNAPETIGYASSAGCVRLTNWDALFLSKRVSAGTPVRFQDT